MTLGIVGKKLGMTRVFQKDGSGVPVTVVQVQPNRVTQIKTSEKEGHSAIQVTAGEKKASRVNKPEAGHFAKAGVEAGEGLWEFPLPEADLAKFALASEITVEIFKEGQFVDVQGRSIGKGFAGVIKRHNFSMQDATHGNSRSHRAAGSTGQNQSPGRVFKNKRMPGHMGNATCTVQNLKVVQIDVEKGLLLIKGAIPGHKGGFVVVKPAVKKPLPTA